MWPGDGTERFGILGVDAALDRVAAKLDRADDVVELLAGREANLRFDEIDLRHHFRDGMLDLNARVHLDEVEIRR